MLAETARRTIHGINNALTILKARYTDGHPDGLVAVARIEAEVQVLAQAVRVATDDGECQTCGAHWARLQVELDRALRERDAAKRELARLGAECRGRTSRPRHEIAA